MTAVLAVAAVAAAGCSGASTGATSSTSSTGASGPAAGGSEAGVQHLPTDVPPVSPVEWAPCGGAQQCGSVTVPIDYRHPAAGTLSIAVARLPATDPSLRQGALVYGQGGPGLSGIASLSYLASRLPAAVTERFDLVAFDPRGTGKSSKLDCGTDPVPIVASPPVPPPGQPLAAAPLYRAMVSACAEHGGPLFRHADSMDTARDVERIRVAIGEQRISFLGVSYGTRLGYVYAVLFPTRVRAMVLDGAVDPTETIDLQARDEAAASEASLGTYLRECPAVPGGCPIGPDPAGLFDHLQEQLRAHPLSIPGSSVPVTDGDLQSASLLGVTLWDQTGGFPHALASAAAGDGSALRTDAQLLFDDSDGTTTIDPYWAIMCNDEVRHPSETAAAAEARALAASYPRLGAFSVAYLVAGCSSWPAATEPTPEIRSGAARGSPPILVIGTTGDPNTPYVGAQHLAKALSAGVLLTRVGQGHTWFFTGQDNQCVSAAVSSYLVSLHTPPNGTRCLPGPTPPGSPAPS